MLCLGLVVLCNSWLLLCLLVCRRLVRRSILLLGLLVGMFCGSVVFWCLGLLLLGRLVRLLGILFC